MRKIIGTCVICGKRIVIKINQDKTYSGANYFGTIQINGEVFEYWECNTCYNSWSEKKKVEK